MSNVVDIEAVRCEYTRDVNSVLDEAKSKNLETVYIVGFTKDDRVVMMGSKAKSTLEVLGMLEATKDHVLRTW